MSIDCEVIGLPLVTSARAVTKMVPSDALAAPSLNVGHGMRRMTTPTFGLRLCRQWTQRPALGRDALEGAAFASASEAVTMTGAPIVSSIVASRLDLQRVSSPYGARAA
jgi:hypothetical protein